MTGSVWRPVLEPQLVSSDAEPGRFLQVEASKLQTLIDVEQLIYSLCVHVIKAFSPFPLSFFPPI